MTVTLLVDTETGAVRTRCPRCEVVVVAVNIGAWLPVLVEVAEVVARERCPTCLSKRQLKYPCWRCDDSQWIGEDLTGVLAVAIDDDGHGRLMPYGADDRRRGEAVHRAHHCPEPPLQLRRTELLVRALVIHAR